MLSPEKARTTVWKQRRGCRERLGKRQGVSKNPSVLTASLRLVHSEVPGSCVHCALFLWAHINGVLDSCGQFGDNFVQCHLQRCSASSCKPTKLCMMHRSSPKIDEQLLRPPFKVSGVWDTDLQACQTSGFTRCHLLLVSESKVPEAPSADQRALFPSSQAWPVQVGKGRLKTCNAVDYNLLVRKHSQWHGSIHVAVDNRHTVIDPCLWKNLLGSHWCQHRSTAFSFRPEHVTFQVMSSKQETQLYQTCLLMTWPNIL